MMTYSYYYILMLKQRGITAFHKYEYVSVRSMLALIRFSFLPRLEGNAGCHR